MPGPGQGKQAHKKKWCENAPIFDVNMVAVNAVIVAVKVGDYLAIIWAII
jgi:hypothetical protein